MDPAIEFSIAKTPTSDLSLTIDDTSSSKDKHSKVSILLPLKENFSPNYPGAVSLFVNDTLSISKYKNNSINLFNHNNDNNFIIICFMNF